MGPTIVVLVSEPVTIQKKEEITQLLQSIAHVVQYHNEGYGFNQLGSWDISEFIGPIPNVSSEDLNMYILTISIGDMSESDRDEKEYLLMNLGYYPVHDIICDAPIEEAYYVLNYVVWRLAKMLQGYISLNTAVYPTQYPERYDQERLFSLQKNAINPETQTMIPWKYEGVGNVYEISYDPKEGYYHGYYNIVDCECFYANFIEKYTYYAK